jgi:NADH-quinone oxidoreductase subunit C
MTRSWGGEELAAAVRSFAPDVVVAHDKHAVWVTPGAWLSVAQGLRDRHEFAFDLLNSVSAVDYIGHFEVVYHLTSLRQNRSAIVKVKCGEGRQDPVVPSVVSVWRGADFQEREAYDLMGVRFDGHPNMKRIMLWDGFPGHPLRKDFVTYDQSLVPLEPMDHAGGPGPRQT